MRRKIVVGNWKMNGKRRFVTALIREIRQEIESLSNEVDIVVCPSFVHLAQVGEELKDSRIVLGAQNVYRSEFGSYTGEVSAPMLAELEVGYVIVGHSERRQLFAEDDQLVSEKFLAVQASGMIPILCLGETLEQREQGMTHTVISEQLDYVLKVAGVEEFRRAVIAYEPIWAIGTGMTATPEQAQDAHCVIRQRIAALDEKIAENVSILYGGSLNASNARQLFDEPDIDGGLVGGASLKATEFNSICKSAGY